VGTEVNIRKRTLAADATRRSSTWSQWRQSFHSQKREFQEEVNDHYIEEAEGPCVLRRTVRQPAKYWVAEDSLM
jgi:hypothetical protein